MTKVEDLHGVGQEVADQVPDPVRPIGQHDHFGRLRAPCVLIDLGDERAKRRHSP